jgi:Glycosyl hydrolase family 79 C-terminal beta domain
VNAMSANGDPSRHRTRHERAQRARRRRSSGLARLLLLVAAVVLLAVIVVPGLPEHDAPTKALARSTLTPAERPTVRLQPKPPPQLLARVPQTSASATVTLSETASTVPSAFLGLSTEYWALPIYQHHLSLFERALSLLHAPGDGPMVLRIGGDSADHSFWAPRARRAPKWAFDLNGEWLSHVRSLVQRLGLRVILDLNLVTGSPRRGAQWAQAAETELPRGSIVGFEVGNEPDIYSHHYWREAISRASPGTHLPLPRSISSSSYVKDFQAYGQQLGSLTSRTPLAGPVLAHPSVNVGWVSKLLASAHPGLGLVTAHSYPYSACVRPSSSSYPTVTRVLSERASAGVAQAVAPAVRLAHRAGLPFRMTELNSVTCGGRRGVSNTFATALWAPDTLFELMRTGVDGVNMHIRANPINAPFALWGNRLDARPLLYGLIMFVRTLGPHAQLVNLGLRENPSLNVKAWAVRVLGDKLHVLLIDKGGRSASVDLRLPSSGLATVQRLLAPSARATSGVTLAGQRLGADGAWHGRRQVETILPGPTGYRVTLPAASAALVSVQLHSAAPVPKSRPLAVLSAPSSSAPRRAQSHGTSVSGHGVAPQSRRRPAPQRHRRG